MQSLQHNDGSVFELGPRSLRPAGKSGKNTLRLVSGIPWHRKGDKPYCKRSSRLE